MQSAADSPPRFSLAAKWKRETEDWKGGERREISKAYPTGPDLNDEEGTRGKWAGTRYGEGGAREAHVHQNVNKGESVC